MHVQSRRRGNWCGVSRERGCEVCVLQHWENAQPRQNGVYSYVCLFAHSKLVAITHLFNPFLLSCHSVHMQQWRRASRCGLFSERGDEMRVMQHWVDSQPRPHSVYSYVHACIRICTDNSKTSHNGTTICLMMLQSTDVNAKTAWAKPAQPVL